MDSCLTYIVANGAVLVLVLGQMFRVERRLGRASMFLDQIEKRCPLFKTGVKNGKKTEIT